MTPVNYLKSRSIRVPHTPTQADEERIRAAALKRERKAQLLRARG